MGRKEDTELFQSLTKFGAVSFQFFENNRDGLSKCYNEVLDARAGRDEIVVLVHDNVFLTDSFIAEKLNSAVDRYGYVIAGVAGAVSLEIAPDDRPTRWLQPQPKANSGAFECRAEDETLVWWSFGVTPARCVALDGVLLAVDIARLKGVRFDERFKSDFHDLDFCLTADTRGLLAGTTNIHLTRKLPNAQISPDFEAAQSTFRAKWKRAGSLHRSVASDIVILDSPQMNHAFHSGPFKDWMGPLCHIPDILPPSGWYGHIPFLSLMVTLLRPRVFVELGVFLGTSFFAGCSAAERFDTQTRCFGVDTWEGDEHAGFYAGDELLRELQTYAGQKYPNAELVRARFAEALPRFADGSIDLLHIDGLHTYEAVSEDFKAWLPKLSDQAVVLFHDTQVRELGFGVWKFWQEARRRYPHYEFRHCSGLGVLVVGKHVPDPVHELIRYTSESQEKAEILQRVCGVLADSMVIRTHRRNSSLPERESAAAVELTRRLEILWRSLTPA